MKALLRKAISYTPEVALDFIMSVYYDLDIEHKAIFKANLINYFLSDTLLYEDELNVEK